MSDLLAKLYAGGAPETSRKPATGQHMPLLAHAEQRLLGQKVCWIPAAAIEGIITAWRDTGSNAEQPP